MTLESALAVGIGALASANVAQWYYNRKLAGELKELAVDVKVILAQLVGS
jgi:hypothetical protein